MWAIDLGDHFADQAVSISKFEIRAGGLESMRKRYTASAEKVLENAGKEAVSRGMSYVGTEHLLLALIKTKGVAAEVLRENAVNAESLEEMIQEMDKSAAGVLTKEKGDFTPRVRKVIEQSVQEAEHLGTELAGTEHLLIALLKETECIAVRLLGTVGINLQKLYMDSLIAAGQDMNTAKNEFLMHKMNKSKSTTPVLDQYSRDLTEYARNGKLDPVIGRDREIDRLVQILSRRTKNNPCLIGDPGVGKTAIVEGLALKIAEGEIPEIIQGKRVLTLDLSGMVAGSKYRGEFEERIKRALKEVTGSGNILLFIDEIHRLPKQVEEVLYPAMEDYCLDIVVGKDSATVHNIRINLPPFTLVGATTRAGDLSAPLRDRFGIISQLEYYNLQDLEKIVYRTSCVMNTEIDKNAVTEIALRSRGTPRIANRLFRRVRDFAQVYNEGVISSEIAKTALDRLRVDHLGLDAVDHKYLKGIIERFKGGPVGLEAIASSIGEEPMTLEDVYEPYLLQIGFINRTPRGRIVTPKAYEHLQIPYQKELFTD